MRNLAVVLIMMLIAVSVGADTTCPCIPREPVWFPSACDTWNCAAAALILGNGDRNVIAVPTGSARHPWIVLRRMVSGAAFISPDEPFRIESFSQLSDAVARFSAIDPQQKPMFVTASDGTVLLIYLQEPEQRQRSAAH
jgi:hypothetical protein